MPGVPAPNYRLLTADDIQTIRTSWALINSAQGNTQVDGSDVTADDLASHLDEAGNLSDERIEALVQSYAAHAQNDSSMLINIYIVTDPQGTIQISSNGN